MTHSELGQLTQLLDEKKYQQAQEYLRARRKVWSTLDGNELQALLAGLAQALEQTVEDRAEIMGRYRANQMRRQLNTHYLYQQASNI